MADELTRALARVRREELETEGAPPLSGTARADVLAAVFARLDMDECVTHDDMAPASIVAPIVPLVRRRWVTPLVTALAAAVLLVVMRPSASDPVLPSYSVTRARGGDAAMRSTPDEPTQELRLTTPRDSIDVVVTPSTATSTAIDVTLFARRAAREPVHAVITGAAEIASQGAIRLHGPLDRFVALEPGAWRVDVVVSPVGTTPPDAEALDRDASQWSVATLEITIASP